MVRRLEHDHVLRARVRAREPQRELVRLARRVEQIADAERIGERGGEPLGVRVEQIVQVARVGIEHRHLPVRRGHHARMRVADVRHVVVRVEILAPLVIVEILPPSARDAHRIVVGDAQIGAEVRPPPREVLSLRHRHRHPAGRDPDDEIRIGTEVAPDRALRRPRHAGEVGVEAERVGEDLQMEMRRPVSVLRRHAERGDPVAAAHLGADAEAVERRAAEVTVERVEGRAVTGLVAEHDHRTVVLRRIVVREGVHGAVERGEHGRARIGEEIETDVDGAPLAAGTRSGRERGRGVDQARLVVASDRERDLRLAHRREDPRR